MLPNLYRPLGAHFAIFHYRCGTQPPSLGRLKRREACTQTDTQPTQDPVHLGTGAAHKIAAPAEARDDRISLVPSPWDRDNIMLFLFLPHAPRSSPCLVEKVVQAPLPCRRYR